MPNVVLCVIMVRSINQSIDQSISKRHLYCATHGEPKKCKPFFHRSDCKNFVYSQSVFI